MRVRRLSPPSVATMIDLTLVPTNMSLSWAVVPRHADEGFPKECCLPRPTNSRRGKGHDLTNQCDFKLRTSASSRPLAGGRFWADRHTRLQGREFAAASTCPVLGSALCTNPARACRQSSSSASNPWRGPSRTQSCLRVPQRYRPFCARQRVLGSIPTTKSPIPEHHRAFQWGGSVRPLISTDARRTAVVES